MNYYVEEVRTDEISNRNAAGKARSDVNAILEQMGMKLLVIHYNLQNRGTGNSFDHMKEHWEIKKRWEESTQSLQKGDSVYVQFPSASHSIFLSSVFRKLKKRGIRVVLIVHDLELFRVAKTNDVSFKLKLRSTLEERNVINKVDGLILHNPHMIAFMKEQRLTNHNMVSLGIFDYLLDDNVQAAENQQAFSEDMLREPVIVAGNLHPGKAKYLYSLPENQNFRLYGVQYQEQNQRNVEYMGAFDPGKLPYLLKGSFGLVWDGESTETCSGIYGEYLKINNPHKTSLYLAAGIPVIIWDQAALADFVKQNHCGITVSSLYEIHDKINRLSDAEYEQMRAGARSVAQKLHRGEYLKAAVAACEQ